MLKFHILKFISQNPKWDEQSLKYSIQSIQKPIFYAFNVWYYNQITKGLNKDFNGFCCDFSGGLKVSLL